MRIETIKSDYTGELLNWNIAKARLDAAADNDDEDKREDGLIWCLLDMAAQLSFDFINKGGGSQEGFSEGKIKRKNKKFAAYFKSQNIFFKRCATLHAAYIINAKPHWAVAPESYASIICINAMMDHKLEAESKGELLDMENFSTYKFMRAAGYPVDLGLGEDLIDMMLDYGLMKVVADGTQ